MKETKTKEIVIEIERVRIRREHPAVKRTATTREKQNIELEAFGCANAFAKNGNRLEHLFDKLF